MTHYLSQLVRGTCTISFTFHPSIHTEEADTTYRTSFTRLEITAEQIAWLANKDIATTDDEAKYEWWDLELSPSVDFLLSIGTTQKIEDEAGAKAGPGDIVGLILDKPSFTLKLEARKLTTESLSLKLRNSM